MQNAENAPMKTMLCKHASCMHDSAEFLADKIAYHDLVYICNIEKVMSQLKRRQCKGLFINDVIFLGCRQKRD